MEPIELCAWHESGRIFYAYLAGYTCDGAELSGTDPGGGKSKLNGGDDTPYIQAILSGKTQAILLEDKLRAVDVAKKLIKIYCAGSCVRTLQEMRGRMDGQAGVDIPGQDIKQLDLLQKFLLANSDNHDEDYINQVLTVLFRELRSDEIMKPIRSLAAKWLKSPEGVFSRFSIEDALMAGGFRPRKPVAAGRHGLQLSEDHSPRQPEAEIPASPDEAPLDKALRNFLQLVRKEWSEEEMQASIAFLKDVFRKLGKN